MYQDDPDAQRDARSRRVTLVLEAFYAERDRAHTRDDPMSAPFQGDDVIYGYPHVTVGAWLIEAISSGANRVGRSRDDCSTPGATPAPHRARALHQAQRALHDRRARGARRADTRAEARHVAAGEAVESWAEIRDERNGCSTPSRHGSRSPSARTSPHW
jgi:hypothetical protein